MGFDFHGRMPAKCDSEAIPKTLSSQRTHIAVVGAQSQFQGFGCSESRCTRSDQNEIRHHVESNSKAESDVIVRRHLHSSGSPRRQEPRESKFSRMTLSAPKVHVQIFSGASRDRVNVTFRGKQSEDSSETSPAMNPDSPAIGTRRGRLRSRKVSSP